MSDDSDYTPELRGHLEAQIANVADELAYTAHDLDDGLRSQIIDPQMLEGIEFWEVLVESVGYVGSVLEDVDRHRLIRRMVGILVTDSVEATSQEIKRSRVKTVKGIQKLDYNVACFSEDIHRRNRELKDFLYSKLYRYHRVVRMSKKAERVIADLFNAYCDEPAMLNEHFRNLIEERGLERTVCDYLAGMTDRYAIQEYGKLFDPLVKP